MKIRHRAGIWCHRRHRIYNAKYRGLRANCSGVATNGAADRRLRIGGLTSDREPTAKNSELRTNTRVSSSQLVRSSQLARSSQLVSQSAVRRRSTVHLARSPQPTYQFQPRV